MFVVMIDDSSMTYYRQSSVSTYIHIFFSILNLMPRKEKSSPADVSVHFSTILTSCSVFLLHHYRQRSFFLTGFRSPVSLSACQLSTVNNHKS